MLVGRTIIEVDFASRWRAVHVGEGDAISGIVAGPREALCFMDTAFVFKSGPTYHSARKTCLAAITGMVDSDHARRCFVAAYAEDYIKKCWIEGHYSDSWRGQT
jgi:hypothetical protein